MTTIPVKQREELEQLAYRLEGRRTLRKFQAQQVREAVGPYMSEWEGITSSGILIKDMPGIHPPKTLGIPLSLNVLRKAFPELEVS